MSNKLQHYIPRFILRRFGDGDGWLHAIDKHTGNRFRVRASKDSKLDVAAECGMYDFKFLDTPLTLEPALAKLESRAASVVKRIMQDGTLHPADSEERAVLSHFLAVQMVRTRAIWVTQQELFGRMQTWLRENGASEDFFRPDPYVGSGENAEKALRASMICKAEVHFAPAIAEKDWVLLKSDSESPYLIGDHPFAMFNQVDHHPRGNLGLKVRGIELYFPLSPTLALALWCPSLQREVLDGIARLDALADRNPSVMQQYIKVWEDGRQTVEAIRTGSALKSRAENVLHFNSLQVSMAERFVFSSNGDFALVEQMIQENPELKFGRRFEEATGKF